MINAKAVTTRVQKLLTDVGLRIRSASRNNIHMNCHRIGEMRQRVMIAITPSNETRFDHADEPTTALDATANTKLHLKLKKFNSKRMPVFLLITHDLVGVVAAMADKVAVMYAGQNCSKKRRLMTYLPSQHTRQHAVVVAGGSVRCCPGRGVVLTIPGTVPTLKDMWIIVRLVPTTFAVA